MNNQIELVIKTWEELTEEELLQMNNSHKREWNISSMSKEYHGQNIFFLLKDPVGNILAQGQLVPIDGVIFNSETFNILGIGGIIANVKGKGFGRKIMHAIKEYLEKEHKSGVGFTGFSGFYEKCGFSVNKEAIKRFVYRVGDIKKLNTESDRVCYLDSEDKFMEKVILNPDKEVLLPREPDW